MRRRSFRRRGIFRGARRRRSYGRRRRRVYRPRIGWRI